MGGGVDGSRVQLWFRWIKKKTHEQREGESLTQSAVSTSTCTAAFLKRSSFPTQVTSGCGGGEAVGQ